MWVYILPSLTIQPHVAITSVTIVAKEPIKTAAPLCLEERKKTTLREFELLYKSSRDIIYYWTFPQPNSLPVLHRFNLISLIDF